MSRLKNSDTFIKKVFIYRPAYLSIQNSVSFFELSQDTFYFFRKIYNFSKDGLIPLCIKIEVQLVLNCFLS